MIRTILEKLASLVPERYAHVANPFLDKARNTLLGTDEAARSQRMAASVFTIRVASAIIAFVSQVLLARWMGTFEYGIFVAVWTAVIILDTLVSFGMPTAAVRFVSKYREENRNGLLWGTMYGSMGLTFVSSTIFAFLAVLALTFKPDLLTSYYMIPALLGALCIPIMAVASIAEVIARAFNWTIVSFVPTFIVRPIAILAILWIALTLGYGASAVSAMWAALIAAYGISLIQILLIRRKINQTVPREKPEFKLKYWIVVALPIFLVESFYVLLTSVDVLFVSWLTKPEDAAVYFATTKILALVHFVYFAVRAAAAHRYSAYHSAGNHAGLKAYVTQSVAWTFWPSLIIGIFMIATGKYFLLLFGPEFTAGASILWILVMGIVIRASVGPAESLLVMTGNQNSCAAIYVLALFVNITLNLSLIPEYGLAGAAIATAVAMGFESAALYVIIRRKLNLHAFIIPSANKADAAPGSA